MAINDHLPVDTRKKRGSPFPLFLLATGVGGVLIAMVVLQYLNQGYQSQALLVGTDTTRITGPLTEDGKVDYLAAINEGASGGNEDNAFAHILSKAIQADSKNAARIFTRAVELHRFPSVDASQPAVEMQRRERIEWLIGLSKMDRYEARWIQNQTTSDGRVATTQILDSDNCATVVLEHLLDLSANVSQAIADEDLELALACSEALLRLRNLSRKSLQLHLNVYPFQEFDNWFQAESELLSSGKLSRAQLESHLEEIRKHAPDRFAKECIDRDSRWRLLDLLQTAAEHGPDCLINSSGNLVTSDGVDKDRDVVNNIYRAFNRVNINEEARQLNVFLDDCVQALNFPDFAARWDLFSTAQEDFGSKFVFDEQAFAFVVAINYFDAVVETVRWELESIIEHELAITATALELYRIDNGNYPTSLSDLVPKYVPALPTDPNSLAPFIYKVKRQSVLLYSVGLDTANNDGMNRSEAALSGSPEYDHRYLKGKLSDF